MKVKHSLILENIRISLNSIRSHLLRTVITIMIIALGITALVGILTSIDSIKYFLNQNFSMMGANTLTIQNRGLRVHMGANSTRPKTYRPITYQEAMRFREEFDFPAHTSVFVYGTGIATLTFGSETTHPNVPVIGTDDEYIMTSGNEIISGRNFNVMEMSFGSNVAIIGSSIVSTLFKAGVDPLGQMIGIGPDKFMVIGVLKEKGSSIGISSDNHCIVPLDVVRRKFARPNMTYSINIMVPDAEMLPVAESEATGLFRIIRQVNAGDETNFDVSKSDNLAEMLFDNLKYLTMAATVIGLITLIGAAIGLMNIMLVSVTERTREIGIRKAIGATKRTIRNQFLAEAIVIAQLGGILGIILGILAGNGLGALIGSGFIIPWVWIIGGVVLCFIVALVSGILPATKAANLDPVESLRYE
ncbi:MAG: ABC transporter permease [Bacteroidales bacterium]|nr:ABC transporter permease [Bacteroidales bacterium]